MRRFCYILLWFLLCSLVLKAQYGNTVYVRGYVLDESQHAVELVTIFENSQLVGAISNASGYYELQLQRSDTLRVTYSCIGYETVEKVFGGN